MHRISGKATLVCALAALIGGCATPGDVAQEAVDANLAFERQNNDLMLLNVLRASKDLPMHFSRINTLRLTAGTTGWNAKAAYPALASLPVIGAGAQLGSATQRGGLDLGLAGPSLPALDVTPLDGQEFMQGIMSPVPLAALPVMSELGWPTELLFYLLIDSVSIKSGAQISLWQNDPRSDSYNDFTAFVANLKPSECVLVSLNAAPVRFTPDYSAGSASNFSLEGVAAVKAGGLAPLPGAGGSYYFGLTPKQIALNCRARSAQPATTPPNAGNAAPTPGTSEAIRQWRNAIPGGTDKSLQELLRENFSVKQRGDADSRVALSSAAQEITATLRSPYGVLTYLGALHQSGASARFSVKSGRGPKDAVIARAELFGEAHHIPADAAGTSTAKSLAIAWQLLQLQSKGSAAPVTGTVRLAQ